MEGWRQWQLGRRKNLVQRKTNRFLLTPTGLLMEGDNASERLLFAFFGVNECYGDLSTAVDTIKIAKG
jgi:hypothetical protein